MNRIALLLVVVSLLTAPSAARATAFSTADAKAVTGGSECKKASVELTEDMITVDCKKGGYARKLTELHNLSWSISGGWGTMLAEESDGNSFMVSVKKSEFTLLKTALLSNLKAVPAEP
jgi:hypothetical protein